MNIGIFGATGRLGREIGAEILLRKDMKLTAVLGRSSLGVDYGVVLGGAPLGVLVEAEAKGRLPDLFIDVSLREGLRERLTYGRPMVIGTTGFSEEERCLLKEAAKNTAIFYSSNFSLGMALLKKMAADLARLFPGEVCIEETHHTKKKDAPSGSALSLAEAIEQVRPEIKVPIASIRLSEVVGEHVLTFRGVEEKLRIAHEACSRRVFAWGALAAAKFIMGKPPGLYGMDELLAEKKETGAL